MEKAKHKCRAWDSNPGHRVLGANGSTGLWRPPRKLRKVCVKGKYLNSTLSIFQSSIYILKQLELAQASDKIWPTGCGQMQIFKCLNKR